MGVEGKQGLHCPCLNPANVAVLPHTATLSDVGCYEVIQLLWNYLENISVVSGHEKTMREGR